MPTPLGGVCAFLPAPPCRPEQKDRAPEARIFSDSADKKMQSQKRETAFFGGIVEVSMACCRVRRPRRTVYSPQIWGRSPTRRVRLPGSWYKSAVTPRDCHGPCGASPGASGGTKPPQRSSPLRRQLFRKNQMRATPEAFAASATAAATALPTRGSNAFGMI